MRVKRGKEARIGDGADTQEAALGERTSGASLGDHSMLGSET